MDKQLDKDEQARIMAEALFTVIKRPRTGEYALVPLAVYKCYSNKGGVTMLDTALGELPYFMAVRTHEAARVDLENRHDRIVRYLSPKVKEKRCAHKQRVLVGA
jgi:hypothetical protein